MMTLRERAELIGNMCSHETGFITHAQLVEHIECHLREACEEAVKEDRKRYNIQNSAKVYGPLNTEELDRAAKELTEKRDYPEKPTAEDALKRIEVLESNIATQRDMDGVAFREIRTKAEDALKAVVCLCDSIRYERDVWPIQFGCIQLLRGNRDGSSARVIVDADITNNPKNSTVKP